MVISATDCKLILSLTGLEHSEVLAVADRMEANGEVRESLVHVFSNIFGTIESSTVVIWNCMKLFPIN